MPETRWPPLDTAEVPDGVGLVTALKLPFSIDARSDAAALEARGSHDLLLFLLLPGISSIGDKNCPDDDDDDEEEEEEEGSLFPSAEGEEPNCLEERERKPSLKSQLPVFFLR